MGPEGPHNNLALPFLLSFVLFLFLGFAFFDCLFVLYLLLWLLGLQQTQQTTNQGRKNTNKNFLFSSGLRHLGGEVWQKRSQETNKNNFTKILQALLSNKHV